MADLAQFAVRRLIFLRAVTRRGISGVQNKLIQRQLCIPTQVAAPDIPFYRKPWRIFVAVLLKRKPIISKDLSDLEKRFYAFQSNLEYEQSALSNHEVNKLKLMKGSKQTKQKTTEEEEQRRLECEQELSRIEDEEEAATDELNNFQLASRTSPVNEHSLSRHLDSNLHLVVNFSGRWMLPETELVNGESLRQAAERLINAEIPNEVRALFLSNAPAGVLTERIEASKRDESETQGKKVFYYKATLHTENNKHPDFGTNSKWLTLNEMEKTLPSEHFYQIVKFAS